MGVYSDCWDICLCTCVRNEKSPSFNRPMSFRDHLLTPTNSLPSHRGLEVTSPHLCIMVIGPDGPPSSSAFSLPPFPRSNALPFPDGGPRPPTSLAGLHQPKLCQAGGQGPLRQVPGGACGREWRRLRRSRLPCSIPCTLRNPNVNVYVPVSRAKSFHTFSSCTK